MKYTLVLLLLLAGCTSSPQVTQGVTEIIVIAYQPGSRVGNRVADIKDSTERGIWRAAGTNRVQQAVGSQGISATRAAIGNSSNTVLKQLTGGIIDLENLDHY